MLQILGSHRKLCHGVPRREFMRVGALGSVGLSLPQLLSLQQASAAEGSRDATFGRAKRIILLYLYGAAAQHETFDPKPEAPPEIRGEFKPIATAVPGVAFCEHLPKLAGIADRLCVIRSMSHRFPLHSTEYALTGVDDLFPMLSLKAEDPRHWPFFGSVLEYLEHQKNPRAPLPEIPRNIALPFRFSSKLSIDRSGPYGGFLGAAFNPVWTEFEGQSPRSVSRTVFNRALDVKDPFVSVSPNDRITFSKDARLPADVTLDRLDRRRSLLGQLERQLPKFEGSLAATSLDGFQQMAYSLITSRKLRNALDLQSVDLAERQRYGMNLFGQATLTGRRLLEAGAPLVSVFWDEYETINSGWDTHVDHYSRLKDELLPGLDSALTALIRDLEERGMFDDTLILCLTEHGRTPKISTEPRGCGREHWSQTYCNVIAGAGLRGGAVIGSSDADGGYVKDNPVHPKDVLCTMYHLLGVDHHRTIPDRLGRPLPLVASGRVLTEALDA